MSSIISQLTCSRALRAAHPRRVPPPIYRVSYLGSTIDAIQLPRTLFTFSDLSSLTSGSSGEGSDEIKYHERKILPFTRRQLFEVVADVNSYPSFVPYCKHVSILSPPTRLSTDGTTVEEASMTVGFLGFTESYTSRVTSRPHEYVEAVAISGTPLFKSLATTWRFQTASSRSPHPTADGLPPTSTLSSHTDESSPDVNPTLVTLDLVYAFANPVHAAVSRAFFGQVSKLMVEAFENRCLDVYRSQ